MVNIRHENNLPVAAEISKNSVAGAAALSGLAHDDVSRAAG